jgi:hypothetical protein
MQGVQKEHVADDDPEYLEVMAELYGDPAAKAKLAQIRSRPPRTAAGGGGGGGHTKKQITAAIAKLTKQCVAAAQARPRAPPPPAFGCAKPVSH